MKRKIIIDCDPGIDDSYALSVALLHRGFEVLGIHTVSGNISVEHTTRNARGVLQLISKDVNVPIFKGASEPLVLEPIFAADIHGNNGLAGYQFKDEELAPLSELSSLFGYVKQLSESETPVTIVAVGPLTNVAVLLKAYPHLKEKIECIAIMGGGLKGGNITALGEFNFYVDPHAADVVFRSGIPLLMAGLDVTEEATLPEKNVYSLKGHSPLGDFLATVTEPSLARNAAEGRGRVCQPNDVVPLVALLHPEYFEKKALHVRVSTESGVSRGFSYADVRTKMACVPNVEVLTKVDVEAFRGFVMRVLLGE